MEQASVYVATALADGTSPALLEAIAAGLTPVVTDIEANRSLVNDGQDGFLFKSSDPEDLAKNIIHALSGGIPNAALDRKRQEFRSRISWNSVAREFISIYNELTPKTWGVYTE
jgi:glycosyltransferase involved in cell wall biosynthesis